MSVKYASVAAGFDSCSPSQKARLREGAGLRFVYGASDRNRRGLRPLPPLRAWRPSRAALANAPHCLSSAPATGFDSCSPSQKARLREGAGLRFVYGASDRNRTRNPLITNQLLYR